MYIIIICQKCYFAPLASMSRQDFLLKYALNRWASILQISTINCWLGNVQSKNIDWRHWWSIHILVISNEIYCTTVELWSLLMIRSVAIFFNSRVVIILCSIYFTAKWTHPFLTILQPSDEWIDIGSAVSTSHDWIIFEIYFWNCRLLTIFIL